MLRELVELTIMPVFVNSTNSGHIMSNRELAKQALRYLASLNKPLPDESDTEFYDQNRTDYEALLTLNNKAIGASEAELQELANAPLSDTEVNRIVKRLSKIDELVFAEHAKDERIERDPKYWDGFFSGYEASPTRRCEQLQRGIKARISKLSSEQFDLFGQLTMQQAMEFGYCVDGMDEDDFKSE